MDIFNEFQSFSGLKVNLDKTEIVPLGPIKDNFIILRPDLGIKWSSGPLKILGVYLCHTYEDLIRINFMAALDKIVQQIKLWKKRNLTLYGKVVVLNTFVISQLTYLLSVLPSPPSNILKTN